MRRNSPRAKIYAGESRNSAYLWVLELAKEQLVIRKDR